MGEEPNNIVQENTDLIPGLAQWVKDLTLKKKKKKKRKEKKRNIGEAYI